MDKTKEYYIEQWKLADLTEIASTFTSKVYKAKSEFGPVVLKLLNEVGVQDEAAGAIFLENCNGEGSAKLYRYDDQAHLVEFLPGENLYQFSKANNEPLASIEFVQIIKKIQSKSIAKRDSLTPLKKIFNIFERVTVPSELKSDFEKAKQLVSYLQSTQEREVLLHGDLHHENVLQRGNGDFVCFDPKGLIGDPAYELGTTLKNPRDYPGISNNIEAFKERVDYFSKQLKLERERAIGYAFIHICMSIGWSIEDGFDYPHQLNLIKMIRPLI